MSHLNAAYRAGAAQANGLSNGNKAEVREPEVLSPADHFALVEPGVYRSSLPSPNNFSHIRSLYLKHVVILSAERPMRSITTFFEENNISVSHTGRHGWTSQKSWKPMSEEVVKESLEIVLRKDCHPILVCDVGGVHLVGMLVACLRRLQHWNLNSVVNEYRAFAGSKTRYANEQFIELFDIDLVTIPVNPPEWFAEQMKMERLEMEEYDQMIRDGHLDHSGTLIKRDTAESYRVYYFSSSSPLNSVHGAEPPRIQII